MSAAGSGSPERREQRWTIYPTGHMAVGIEVVPLAELEEQRRINEFDRQVPIQELTERAECAEERLRTAVEALRALAATYDDELLPDDDGGVCEPLFDRKVLKLVRDYCDEYHTALTPEGRDFVRGILAPDSTEAPG